MKLLSILTENAPGKVFVSLLLGALAGVCYALLIPLVTSSFDSNLGFETQTRGVITVLGIEVASYRFAFLFLCACLLIYVARTCSQLLLLNVVIDATSSLRKKYFYMILRAPLQKLEKAGSPRLIASITTDVRSILDGASRVPDILINSVSILGMLLFILYLNTDVFIFICSAIAFGVVSFFIPVLLGNRYFTKARESVDELQQAIKGNIYGVKELKLSKQKREAYFSDVLLQKESDVRSSNKKGALILTAAVNYGDMISFFIVGYVTFIFVNYHAIGTAEIMAIVMVLLFLTGPASVLMQAIPEIVKANVSLSKLDELFRLLPEEQINPKVQALNEWQQISFNKVTFSYEDDEQVDTEQFHVGPVSFSIQRGDITFIVGGNGSGKSTISKILTGHYQPKTGSLKLDNLVIGPELLSSYRDQVAAIYTDYYLFDQLLGLTSSLSTQEIDQYLGLLKLEHKVTVENGHFSSLALSDGQRKRLALLVSFLEDKDIYLFDEWAADQDPIFKDFFYQEILPQLKQRNKVVIVISHDDRYFDVADKLIVMEEGQLLEVRTGDSQDSNTRVVA
ncbi:MAG: cyclic peptide export ABC transporter [Cyanobacteria bacterium P01_F01_bin.116]